MSCAPAVEEVTERLADGRIRYPESFRVYAERYSVATATIKSWSVVGRKKNDLVPLHSPALMMEWWGRHMKKEVPDGIRRAFIRERDGETPAERVGEKSQKRELDLGSIDLSEIEAGGAKEAYDRIAKIEALVGARLAEELQKEKPDTGMVDYWSQLFKVYGQNRRQWDKDIPGILEKAGELLRKGELIASLASIAGAVASNFRRFSTAGYRQLLFEVRDGTLNVSDLEDADLEALAIERGKNLTEECFANIRESEMARVFQSAA